MTLKELKKTIETYSFSTVSFVEFTELVIFLSELGCEVDHYINDYCVYNETDDPETTYNNVLSNRNNFNEFICELMKLLTYNYTLEEDLFEELKTSKEWINFSTKYPFITFINFSKKEYFKISKEIDEEIDMYDKTTTKESYEYYKDLI